MDGVGLDLGYTGWMVGQIYRVGGKLGLTGGLLGYDRDRDNGMGKRDRCFRDRNKWIGIKGYG